MNIVLALTSILIFAFSLFPSQLYAAANTYYVTQIGGGGDGGDGSKSDPWSVAEFNSAGNWSSSDDASKIDPGDTVYFSGTITSELQPPGDGSAGNYITLDGYAADDTTFMNLSEEEGRAVLERAFYFTNRYCIDLVGSDYFIIQDFEMVDFSHAIRISDDTDNIFIKRNYIHNGGSMGILMTYYSGGSSYITIGGSPGHGNVIKDVGVGTAGGDIVIGSGAHDVIVSYNHLYATKSNGNSGDRGIDGVVPMNGAYNVLIENNSIHSHNDNYYSDPFGSCGAACEGKGEDGIDVKTDGKGLAYGTNNVIIRYNHIYDHQMQSNIAIQGQSHHIYVYGNSLHNSNWGGVFMKEGAGGAAQPISYIYIFSNIIYNERDAGSRIHMDSGGTTVLHNHIYWFGNTFAENGIDNHGSSFTHITGEFDPDSSIINNNIFYKSRTGYSTLKESQVHLQSGVTDLDYNHYYWPGKTSQIYINGKRANAIGGAFGGIETNGSEGDPGLADIANNDYRIARKESAVVAAGVDMGNGAIANFTIQGVFYPVYWDVALGPNTDWSGTIPEVEVLRRDFVGWDIGAYAHVEGDLVRFSIEPPSALRIIAITD